MKRILVFLFVVSNLQAASVGGFADAQFQTLKGQTESNSFTIADGAVYLSAAGGSTRMLVDLPFMVIPTVKSSFLVGFMKAQAYVNHRYNSGLWWQMGQFDAIFGVEVNDSKDNAISRQGILYSGRRVTHLGLMTGYHFDRVNAKILVSNPNNQGSRAGQNLEFGGQLSYSGDFRFSAGFLHWEDITTTMLADVTFGTTIGRTTLDLEGVVAKPNIFGATTGFGVGVFPSIECTQRVRLNLRGELANDYVVIGGTQMSSQMGFAGGFSYRFTENLTSRADYTFLSTTPVSGAGSSSTHQIVFSSLMIL